MDHYVYLTRRERFNAAHKLWVAQWDEQRNLSTFGGCANPNWHGHNYELYITVKGTPDPVTGFCMDLKVLSDIVNERVIDLVDHRNLNLDVPFMNGRQTTAENIVIAFWEQLEAPIAAQGCRLHSLRLFETENNIVEYFGGQ